MLDTLLDQEGLEVDPVDRLEADIPLHKAVRFVNGLSKEEWEAGASLVELLLDAGADPRSVPLCLFFRAWIRERGFGGNGEAGWDLGPAWREWTRDNELTAAQDTQQGEAETARARRPAEHGAAGHAAEGGVRDGGGGRRSGSGRGGRRGADGERE